MIAKTLVLSLPDDIKRRRHIKSHFAEIGLKNFQFVDALGPQHSEVLEFYRQGRVTGYPPCFRCNQVQCSCTNNIIIPQQVANWLSFRKIWTEATRFKESFVLICEDDVVFHKGAINALYQFFKSFSPSSDPVLVRLAKSGSQPFLDVTGCHIRTSSTVTMSNPAYLINGMMVSYLLKRLRDVVISTTSDVWLHRDIASDPNIEALTLSPLLATELSFNLRYAIFPSRIHPKGLNPEDMERVRKHCKRVESGEEYNFLRNQWEYPDA